jgi:hypothetical protein
MRYVAKPNLINNTGMKTFERIEEAVAYLEEKTGHKMDYVRNPKTKEVTYDWELVGKLKRIN